MMGAIKHKLLSSMEHYQLFKEVPACQTWEYHRGVYLIHFRHIPSVVLKPLKLGAMKAFLTGELLAAGQTYFQAGGNRDYLDIFQDLTVPGGVIPDNILPNSILANGILPLLVKISGRNYLWSGGNRYLLTTMIQGRQADYQRPSDLRAAIGTMKIFHDFTHRLILENQKLWAFLRFDAIVEWRKRLREMEICRHMASRHLKLGINDSWCRNFLAYWPEFHNQALEMVDALETRIRSEKGEEARKVICYHDWAYHNVIINNNPRPGSPEAYLIDFDEILVDRPVHDRVNLISRYLRLNSWSPTSLFRILKDFDRFYPWDPGEQEWLKVYLTFPYEFWMLGRQYFIEKQPWSMKYYQDQWDRKIACRDQRKRVLEMLKGGV